jgi:hypothetical protein
MELVYDERGVMIFRGQGITPLAEPAIRRERRVDFDQALSLAGFGLSSAAPSPGDELEITLYWQALQQAGSAYTAFLHLLAADGSGVAGVDEPVLQGLYQPDLWPAGMAMPDRHRLALPPALPPGRYRLDLGLYPTGRPGALLPVAGGDRLPLATLTVGGVATSSPTVPAGITYGNQIRLLGYDLEQGTGDEGDRVQLTLHWQAVDWMDRDYTIFVHLTGPDGAIATQSDAPPGDPFLPTSTWLLVETVVDPHVLTLPADAPPGAYSLLVGVYYAPTDERLQAVDGQGNPLGDAVRLATIPAASESP